MHFDSIHRYWKSIQRRARWLILGHRLSQLVAGVFVSVFCTAAMLSLQQPLQVGVVCLLGGSIISVFWNGVSGFRDWKPWSKIRFIAEFMETRYPQLEGRSLLALDKREESFLRDRAFRLVSTDLQDISPTHVYSSSKLKKGLRFLLFSMLLLVIGQFTLSVTPTQAMALFKGQEGY